MKRTDWLLVLAAVIAGFLLCRANDRGALWCAVGLLSAGTFIGVRARWER